MTQVKVATPSVNRVHPDVDNCVTSNQSTVDKTMNYEQAYNLAIVEAFTGGMSALAKTFRFSFTCEADICAWQSQTFARIAAKFEQQTQHVTAPQMLRAVAELVEEHMLMLQDGESTKTSFAQYLALARRVVEAFVNDAWTVYHPAFVDSKGKQVTAWYSLAADVVRKSIRDLVRPAGKGQAVGFRKASSKGQHIEGAKAMASRVFTINVARAKECRQQLKAGYYLTRGEQWAPAVSDKEKARHQQQTRQLDAFAEVYRVAPAGFSWDVKPDFRGRLYYVAGSISPQAGGIAFYVVTDGTEQTYDATASFAQFMSVLTGDTRLAKACGLLNFSNTPSDFYAETLAISTGEAPVAKDSAERKVAKAYLMPKAYGCGDETAEQRAREIAQEEGIEEATALAVVDSLKQYQGLNVVKEAGAAAVQRAAAEDKQLEWHTPYGFHVVQNYWQVQAKPWFTKGDPRCIPAQITFLIPTGAVALAEQDSGQKYADVAAAANIIQSLDAAFMAAVLAEYKKQTGRTFIAIHDSATLDADADVNEYRRIAWQVFCDLALHLQPIRDVLQMPEPNLEWLDPQRIPMFIAAE